MAKAKKANPVILRRGMAIGTGNAETDDEFLFDCFDLLESAELDELALNVCAPGKTDFDPIFEAAQALVDDKPGARAPLLRAAIAILYRTGAIGVKFRPEERFLYAHTDDPLISPDILGEGSRVRIHPMLHGAYRLNEAERPRQRPTQ